MSKIITQFDLFRNTDVPLRGIASNTWGYMGNCFTAQTVVIHPESLDGLTLIRAFWRLCWRPNITNGAQTAVRLCSSDEGPTNVQQVIATFSGGKGNNPLNEAFDITADFQALIDSHKTPATCFQFTHQSCGDGTYAPQIFSSSIELVLGI